MNKNIKQIIKKNEIEFYEKYEMKQNIKKNME